MHSSRLAQFFTAIIAKTIVHSRFRDSPVFTINYNYRPIYSAAGFCWTLALDCEAVCVTQNCPHSGSETETNQFQNCFKSVLKLF